MVSTKSLLRSLSSLTTVTAFLDPISESPISPGQDYRLLDKREITCARSSRCTYNGNRYCYLQINARGAQKLQVNRNGWRTICEYGGCRWRGRAVNSGTATSHARDVAKGGWASVTQCASNGGAGGRNYAYRNEHFQIEIVQT